MKQVPPVELRRAVLVVALLTSTPLAAQPADDPWFSPDKALHFTAAGMVAMGGYGAAAIVADRVWVRLVAGAGVAAIASVAKELWDLSGQGSASLKDLAWDGLGCAVGLTIAWLLDRFVLEPLMREPSPLAPAPRVP